MLKGCYSEGDTYEETLANIREAAEGWLQVAAEQTAASEPAQLADIELSRLGAVEILPLGSFALWLYSARCERVFKVAPFREKAYQSGNVFKGLETTRISQAQASTTARDTS